VEQPALVVYICADGVLFDYRYSNVSAVRADKQGALKIEDLKSIKNNSASIVR
jgi:hypothetical protein